MEMSMHDVRTVPAHHFEFLFLFQGGILVLDRDTDQSWRLEHPSMQPEPDQARQLS